jgi:hypothetical protein
MMPASADAELTQPVEVDFKEVLIVGIEERTASHAHLRIERKIEECSRSPAARTFRETLAVTVLHRCCMESLATGGTVRKSVPLRSMRLQLAKQQKARQWRALVA